MQRNKGATGENVSIYNTLLLTMVTMVYVNRLASVPNSGIDGVKQDVVRISTSFPHRKSCQARRPNVFAFCGYSGT
jgi:hypothetical protein